MIWLLFSPAILFLHSPGESWLHVETGKVGVWLVGGDLFFLFKRTEVSCNKEG